MSKVHTVLIGAAGTGTAFAAATALRRHWPSSCRIVGQDTNPAGLVTTSLLCDEFIRCPTSSDERFSSHLDEVLRRHRISAYLPLVPAEISLVRARAAEFESAGVSLILADRLSRIDLSDKWEVAAGARQRGVPVPATALGAPAEGVGFGQDLFVKPRFGFGSRGAQRMSRSLFDALSATEKAGLVVQQVCEGPEVTVDTFVAPGDGFIHALVRERVEVKAGVCVKARIFQDPSFTALARLVADAFSLRGAFCFQLMSHDGAWLLTDLNPRPGAGTSMCEVVGSDFHAANFALAWGEDHLRFLRPLASPTYVTRQYADFLNGPAS